jgi:tRNA(adenine34) deaminase
MINNEKYMALALKEAEKAFKKNEVPVGCVIVKDDKVIAKAHNLRQTKKSVLGHAEILAIEKASKKLNSWILEDCTIYVTLEPCPMCAGTILQSRIKKLVFAANEPKFGACGSVINLFENKFNHEVEIVPNVLQEQSAKLLKNFFQILRQNKQ